MIKTKLCKECGQEKPLTKEYWYYEKSKTKDDVYYPKTFCKKCECKLSYARQKRIRQRWKEEGTYAAHRYKEYRKLKDRDPEAWNQLNRERLTIARRKKGVPIRGPLRKYRNEGNGKQFPAKPLVDLLKELGIPERELMYMTGINERQLYALIHVQKTVSEVVIDKILIGLNKPEYWHILYNPER